VLALGAELVPAQVWKSAHMVTIVFTGAGRRLCHADDIRRPGECVIAQEKRGPDPG